MNTEEWVDKRDRGADAYVLRSAGRVLRRRSRKPRSFWLGVICHVLETTARRIEKGSL